MRPAPQRIRPSRADQIRDNRWPAVFEAAVLDLVRDAAAHQTKWILHRGGTGRARNRIANQIRLWRDGTLVTVGRGLVCSDAVTTLLRTHLAPRDETDQTCFTLDTKDAKSGDALNALATTRPWFHVQGLLEEEGANDV